MFSSRVSPDSYHSTLSLGDNHVCVFSFRVTPDSYHSTLSLRDNLTVCFHLSGNITFRPTLRASYIHTEISDISTGLLHPQKNFGYLHRSLTPTQKFRLTPRVSYTHTEISNISPGLLHPHRNSGYLPGSLTPTQKFGISPWVSYTHTEIRDSSPTLTATWTYEEGLPPETGIPGFWDSTVPVSGRTGEDTVVPPPPSKGQGNQYQFQGATPAPSTSQMGQIGQG